MSNINTDLFDLIKTLSETERRLVIKYAFPYKKGGDSTLRKLFQLLSKQNVYNETELRTHIANLPSRKIELWNKIMLVLQTNENRIAMIKARRKLDFIHILGSKNLFTQALKLIQEVKTWADTYNQPYYRSLALQYESGYAQSLYPDNVLEMLPRLRRETMDNAESIMLMVQVFEFYLRSHMVDKNASIPRTNKAQDAARAILNDPLANLPTQKMNLHSLMMYSDTSSSMYYVLKQYDKCYYYENIAREAFWAKPVKSEVDWYHYRAFLSNTFMLHERAENYTLWKEDLEAYYNIIQKQFKNDVLSHSKYHIMNVWYYYKSNQLQSNLHTLTETVNFYHQYKHQLTAEDIIYHQWNFTIIYFDLKEYDKAWGYCFELLNHIEKNFMTDLQEFLNVFFLFIQLEKKEYAAITHQVRKCKKIIPKETTSDYTFDLTAIRFMENMVSNRNSRKHQKEILLQFKEELMQLKEAGHFHTIEVLTNFDYIKWAIEKIDS